MNPVSVSAKYTGSRFSPGQRAARETARRQGGQSVLLHLRRLRQIRRRVGEEVTTRLVLALVIPRLDYCNSLLLAKFPLYTREPLQRVQSAAARLIFELSPSEHINQAYSSYIGYPYAGASSLNYVALCTQLSPDAVLHI